MKTFNVFVMALALAFQGSAADSPTEKLQRGLFEEEANHNLNAAIKEYQSVVAQSDEQRKVTATALFRLGECYRKLGRTNEANAQYQRLLRDFSEQEPLVRLANQWVKTPATIAGNQSELIQELQRRIAEVRVQSIAQQSEVDRLARMSANELLNSEAVKGDPRLTELRAAELQLEQKLAGLKTQFADGHPEVKAVAAQLEVLAVQTRKALEGMVMSAQGRAKLLAEQLVALETELQKMKSVTASDGQISNATTLTQAETEALARVKTLARNSPDLLQNPSKDGLSELQLAARDGYYSVVEFILSQGISPNGPERGSSPVALAAARGHLRIIELLLDRRADVNREDGYGKNALILAAQQGFKSVVELLLARGANVNHEDSEQKTALIYAAQKGFTAVAQLLLERGADVNRADKLNSTALHYAAAYGFAPMTKLLLEKGAKPDILSSNTQSGNRPERDARGQNLWVDNGATALHLAAKGEFVPVVQALLAGGAPVNVGNHYAKVIPLHLAAEKGNSNVCALLLEKGADPNAEDSQGMTSFSRAIISGSAETVALFVAKGADINRAIVFQGSQSYYPLHFALDRTPAVLEAILQKKPDLEVVNSSGRTPLRQAAEQNKLEMVEKLLAAGANPNQRTSQSEALFAAVYQSNPKPELVAALLKHGANPNIVSGGITPLSYAESRSKSRNDSAAPAFEPIVTLLRQHGANEYLQRFSTIGFTRPAWTSSDRGVFYRGTNDYNRHTLFEFLGAVFNSQNVPAFPDLARITIERLEGTNPRPKEISLNVEQLLRGNDCAKDMWLEWGDRVSIPELDHGLNESWAGLSKETQDLLARCVTRRVQVIVKQETNVVKLVQGREDSSGSGVPGARPIAQPIPLGRNISLGTDVNAVPPPKPEKILVTFRLKEVVYGANVLRASSDPTAVRVIRIDSAANNTNQWTIDLTKVATAGEWSNQPARGDKLWNLHDLWLRDGDVIEIPEKQ